MKVKVNRGLEIVRRLLLTTLWGIVAISTVGFPFLGISEYLGRSEPYGNEVIVDDESANNTRASVAKWKKYWDAQPIDENGTHQISASKTAKYYGRESFSSKAELTEFVFKQDTQLFELKKYDEKKESKKNGMWLLIAMGIACPFVGLGLQKLINWILVYHGRVVD